MTKSLKIIFILLLLFVWKGEGVWGQSIDPETGKTILGPDIQRTALVGPDCMVNTMIDVVNVIGGNSSYKYLLDSDLTNSVAFGSVLNADLFDGEILRIKDRKNLYRKGTTVGFCIEPSGGLLNLDLLKLFHVTFYNDGKSVGTATLDQGGTGGGVLGLDLIQLPSDAVSMFAVKAPDDLDSETFDEISLNIGGISLDLLSSLKVRYAFVGDVKQVTLTTNNNSILGDLKIKDSGNVGTIWNGEDNFIDEELENVTPATLSDIWGSSIHLKWNNTYPEGTEVGFVYSKTKVLELGLGPIGYIELYNNGSFSERVELDASIIGLGLIAYEKHNSSIISTKPFNEAKFAFTGGVKLSETSYYYGYVNEKPITPTTCKIDGLGMDATICDNETTYQLSPTPTEGVQWELEKVTVGSNINSERINGNYSSTVQIDLNGKVTGMAFEGYYHFKATKGECSDYLVVKRGVTVSSGCNVPVTENDGYVLQPMQGTEFGISLFEKITDRQNILDNDPDNYAECTPSIALLNNTHFIGVRKTDGSISDGENKKKVGFLVETSSDFLSLSALEFFYIKLYKNGSPLDGTYTVQDWNVVSAGLIGSEKASKSRLGVTIPANVNFDGFALWTGGVADVDLSTIRIYSAYVENIGEGYIDCDDPLGCDAMIVGDGALDKAYINYDGTYLPAISVGAGMTGLENLLSGELNPDRYLRFASIATVASPMSIAVNFGRVLGPSHQSGFVVDRQTFLANVQLIGVTQIKTYLNGNEQEVKSDWSILGADVIGYGDYAYLTFNPTKEYDEIRLVFASGLEALGNLKVYAVFVRNDADGDGIPDCMDPDSCTGDLTGLAVTKDVCVGDNILLSAIANFKNVDSKDYTLTVSDGTSNIYTEKITIKNGLFEHYFKLDEAGQYTLTLTEVLGEGDTSSPNTYTLTFTVHPLETTWGPTSNSTDWNAWNNWSAGSPWTCTNVIIPTDASIYPLLESGVMNGCHYIHFEPNAEVVNTHYLTYTKAWVEIELQPDRYYMVSAPLKGIYSGDWFIAKNDGVARSNKFQVWNESSYPENRINPTIYQRVWEAASANRLASGGHEGVYPNVPTTNWTKPFNLLSTEYNKNEGYDFNALSVWVHPFSPIVTDSANPGDSYVFRFPKEHTKYYYYDENGVIQNPSETLKRENTGRFIYEDADSTFSGFPYYMKVKNIKTGDGHNVYLVGNPFMAHINVAEFLRENSWITSVKVYDGNTNTNVIANPDGEDGILVSNNESTEYEYIAPMQSFFVTMTTEAGTGIIIPDYCEVVFTEDMLKGNAGNKLKSATSDSDKSGDNIHISAEAEGKKAGALLRFTAEANDNFRDREDSEVLIEDEVPPTVAVFTVAEDYALDIQQRRNGGNIPLGLYMAKPADVTLRIDIPEEYSGWVVEDMETKRVYALQPGKENELRLGRMTTNVGRFYLKGESLTGNEVISASQPKISCYMESGSGKLKVRSYDGIMERCEVYSIDGSLRSVANFDSDEYSFPAYKGVNVVKVCFKDGIQTVRKVACF